MSRLFNRVFARMPLCLLYMGLDDAKSIPELRQRVSAEMDNPASYTPEDFYRVRQYYTLLLRQQ